MFVLLLLFQRQSQCVCMNQKGCSGRNVERRACLRSCLRVGVGRTYKSRSHVLIQSSITLVPLPTTHAHDAGPELSILASRTIVDLLKQNSIEFDSFDILSDEEVRQGLKDYSKWPTYPQVCAYNVLWRFVAATCAAASACAAIAFFTWACRERREHLSTVCC